MNKKNLTLIPILTTLVAITTLLFKIPNPATEGYVNLGDGMVFITALLFGGIIGGIAGGIGSALADLMGGYPQWVLPTFIIKGLEGLLVGTLFQFTRKNLACKAGIIRAIPIVLLGGLWMVTGYFSIAIVLYGNTAAISEIPGNLFQAIFGLTVSIPVAIALTRAGITKKLLADRIYFEDGLAACSQSLLRDDNTKIVMRETLEHLHKITEVSQICIYKNEKDNNNNLCMRRIYEVYTKGNKSQLGEQFLHNIPYHDGFVRWKKTLKKGDCISGLVKTFPKSEKETLVPIGIQSILVLPLFVDGTWYGFLEFGDRQRHREWKEQDIRLLQTSAEMISSYITKKMAEEKLTKYKIHLEDLVHKRTKELTQSVSQLKTEISERRKIEKSLRDSESRFKTLVSNIPGAIYRCAYDTEWTMEYVSNEIERISGYPPSGFINNSVRSFTSIIHPDDISIVSDAVNEAIETKKPFIIEYKITHADTSIRWISERGQAVFSDEGSVLWLDGALFDITDFKKAEDIAKTQRQQLIQVDKMASLGILVSGVAHEINNPNNYILLNSNNIADIWQDIKPILDTYYKKFGDFYLANLPYREIRDEIYNLIKGISSGAERIQNIVQNLKDFARQDTGDMSQIININAIVESTIIILSNLIKKSTHHFLTQLNENIPELKGNCQQIEQVIINLASNAFQALDDKNKSVTLITDYSIESKQVVIKICDEGTGIRAEDLKHIMDPFFTTKRDSGGTGLGLSISYQIIKNHNGNLEIKSEYGKGTKATITLPV